MDARYALLALSAATVALGLVLDPGQAPERWTNRAEDMQICLEQENVTEAEMKEFVVEKKIQDENEELKMAVFCFLKRINFFDGVTWNTEVIAESEASNPKILKVINDCLAKDDFTLSAQERAYQAQKCVIESGTFE